MRVERSTQIQRITKGMKGEIVAKMKSEDELVEHLLRADNVLHLLEAKRSLKQGSYSWKAINLDLDEWYRFLKKAMKWAGTKRAAEISALCDEWFMWKPPKNHPKIGGAQRSRKR